MTLTAEQPIAKHPPMSGGAQRSPASSRAGGDMRERSAPQSGDQRAVRHEAGGGPDPAGAPIDGIDAQLALAHAIDCCDDTAYRTLLCKPHLDDGADHPTQRPDDRLTAAVDALYARHCPDLSRQQLVHIRVVRHFDFPPYDTAADPLGLMAELRAAYTGHPTARAA